MKTNTDSEIDKKLGAFYSSFGRSEATSSILRWLLIFFAIIAVAEAAMLVRQSTVIASNRPLIVRVDSVGKAVPVGYEWDFKPQANEVKYFLSQFSQSFLGRAHNPTLPQTYAKS